VTISARSIAVEGVGFGARAVALAGFVLESAPAAVVVADTYGAPAHRVRRGPPRRWDWEREEEILPPPVPLPDDPLEVPAVRRTRRGRRARTAEELLVARSR
jgi:hypothetical protein